jgi:hypothetical protein
LTYPNSDGFELNSRQRGACGQRGSIPFVVNDGTARLCGCPTTGKFVVLNGPTPEPVRAKHYNGVTPAQKMGRQDVIVGHPQPVDSEFKAGRR